MSLSILRKDLVFNNANHDQVAYGESSSHEDAARFKTHNQAYYQPPRTLADLKYERRVVHKNLSQLPVGDPNSGPEHFMTTAGLTYNAPSETPAGTPRHKAMFKAKMERTEVFGHDQIHFQTRPTFKSTTAAQFDASSSVKPQFSPRFVHGGAFRNASQVPNLPGAGEGRNLPSLDQGFETTQKGAYRPPPGGPSMSPRHKFDLPQKNTSTFMALSHHVTPSPAGSSPRGPGVGRINGVREFSTHTDHSQQYAAHYAPAHAPAAASSPRVPAAPAAHYRTQNAGDFASSKYAGVKLHVPPGKGGRYTNRATIDLSTGKYPTAQAHSSSMFLGMQPADGVRARCESRGTLGARLPRKVLKEMRSQLTSSLEDVEAQLGWTGCRGAPISGDLSPEIGEKGTSRPAPIGSPEPRSTRLINRERCGDWSELDKA